MMPPVPLLNRLRPSRLRRRQDQEDRVVQEDREGRLRLSRREDPEVQTRPSDQAELGRKPPIQALR
jgi:hypothetical protein